MYLDAASSDVIELSKGMTITISGPNYKELKTVKQCLKQTFKVLYHLFIERELIIQDLMSFNSKDALVHIYEKYEEEELLEEKIDWRNELVINSRSHEANLKLKNNLFLLNKITDASVYFFSKFLIEKISIDKLMYMNKFKYTKINLISLNFNDFPDLPQSDIRELEENITSIQKVKADYLAQICHEAELLDVEVYGEDDLNLGTYIVQKANSIDTKCDKCKRPKYYHTAYFYRKNVYVKVITEVIGHNKNQIHKEFTRKSQARIKEEKKDNTAGAICNTKNQDNGLFFGGLSGFVNSIFKKDEKNDADSNENKLRQTINKGLTKSFGQSARVIIYTYIECSKCKKKLTDPVELSKIHIEISFGRYLELMLENGDLCSGLFKERDKIINQMPVEKNMTNSRITKRSSDNNNIPDLMKSMQFQKSTSTTDFIGNMMSKSHPKLMRFQSMSTESQTCHCAEASKIRVFQYDKLLIRLSIGYSPYYNVEVFDIFSEKTEAYLKFANDLIIKDKCNSFILNWQSLIHIAQKNLRKALVNLIDRSKIDITIETLPKIFSILNPNNPLSKEPLNRLLLELTPLFEELIKLEQKTLKIMSSGSRFSNHLDIEFVRISLYAEFNSITEMLDTVKNNYFQILQSIALDESKKNKANVPLTTAINGGEVQLNEPKNEPFELSDAQNFNDRKISMLYSPLVSGWTEYNSPLKFGNNKLGESIIGTGTSDDSKEDEERERNIVKNLVEGFVNPEKENANLGKFVILFF